MWVPSFFNLANGRVYSIKDLLKITEEQLKALDSQQQKEQTTSPTPSEKPESEIWNFKNFQFWSQDTKRDFTL